MFIIIQNNKNYMCCKFKSWPKYGQPTNSGFLFSANKTAFMIISCSCASLAVFLRMSQTDKLPSLNKY